MINNLKKTLPTTDSQNLSEIDKITRPSTRAQQRKLLAVPGTTIEPQDIRNVRVKDEVLMVVEEFKFGAKGF